MSGSTKVISGVAKIPVFKKRVRIVRQIPWIKVFRPSICKKNEGRIQGGVKDKKKILNAVMKLSVVIG